MCVDERRHHTDIQHNIHIEDNEDVNGESDGDNMEVETAEKVP